MPGSVVASGAAAATTLPPREPPRALLKLGGVRSKAKLAARGWSRSKAKIEERGCSRSKAKLAARGLGYGELSAMPTTMPRPGENMDATPSERILAAALRGV
jgi:hypothetical protein